MEQAFLSSIPALRLGYYNPRKPQTLKYSRFLHSCSLELGREWVGRVKRIWAMILSTGASRNPGSIWGCLIMCVCGWGITCSEEISPKTMVPLRRRNDCFLSLKLAHSNRRLWTSSGSLRVGQGHLTTCILTHPSPKGAPDNHFSYLIIVLLLTILSVLPKFLITH